MTDSVYLVSGARTPMGGMLGDLADVPATELGTVAIRAVLEKSGVDQTKIDEVFMGCVLPAGLKQCPARQAMLAAGIPSSTGAVTVNKACGSGMQTTIYGIDSIRTGTNNLVLAGGMESMTNAPQILMTGRKGKRLGHTQLFDHMFLDGLEDAYTGKAMGIFAQNTADENGLTREEMDAFAIESLTRAKRAIDDGLLTAEIAPVTISSRKGDRIITDDEQPHKAAVDKIPSLRPAFVSDGTITAANSSSISDGASALLLASEDAVKTHNLNPLARFIAHSRFSRAPEDFTIAPVGAIEKLMEKTGWSAADVDLWEINEAFAMVTMLASRAFDLDPAKVNVHGGACAQGHPVGSTGSRIIVTLAHALKHYGLKRGVAALCIGGGEATAVAIEVV
ncbi:acetyl-CoA acetyltransferase [Luminiphilus syltensis NOR5-1B]|uniref:Acetyl-CoA acetyltransferase n=1 Tax=Luminiphilus syltensis NOR5-1B TaxID=565045 RepID=B8KXS8_9GAMM|nr:thiolase family protein [Luminiphilus syltensis]EED34156.1 acetyl-CoA acetyltransferase [Luminiphilus syltensis NOR5-1B]